MCSWVEWGIVFGVGGLGVGGVGELLEDGVDFVGEVPGDYGDDDDVNCCWEERVRKNVEDVGVKD